MLPRAFQDAWVSSEGVLYVTFLWWSSGVAPIKMEAPRKGRFQNLKNKTLKILRRKRRRAAHDKKTGVHSTVSENSPPPLPPMSAYSDDISEDSELSSTTYPSCEKTVDLPKPQEDESTNTSAKELCPAVVDITSANSKKRLVDMSTDGHKRLTVLLQPRDPLGRDYRMLADKMGYRNDYIKFLGSTKEPVKELIKKYEKGDRKIVELMSLLKDMERWDVVEDLQKYLDETPTPEEIKRRVQARGKIDELKTSRKSYDAFICFAREDGEFVMNKLVKKMENAPYNLHLCLSERDFIPGGSIYDTTAVAIEQRCKKFVVVLSRNFDNSEGSHYESHIAMNLSPGAKEKRLIPVLIEEAYRFKIPRTISHITYLDWLRQDEKNFWDFLARSLGWKPK